MKRTVFAFVVVMVALATLLAYLMVPLAPGKVEAYVGGYLMAVAVQYGFGAALWKELRRTFRD